MLLTSLLLADHMPLFLLGLRQVLQVEKDLQVVGEAHTGADTLEQARARQPDMVLLGTRLQDGSGLELLVPLRQDCPDARVILLSLDGTDHGFLARRNGVHAVLKKDSDPSGLLKAIRAVRGGARWAEPTPAPQLASLLFERDMHRPLDRRLTARELEVLALIGMGQTNREIGAALFISLDTVKTHVQHLMQKLGLHDREMVWLYVTHAVAGTPAAEALPTRETGRASDGSRGEMTGGG